MLRRVKGSTAVTHSLAFNDTFAQKLQLFFFPQMLTKNNCELTAFELSYVNVTEKKKVFLLSLSHSKMLGADFGSLLVFMFV